MRHNYPSDQSDSYDYQDSSQNIHSNSNYPRSHRTPLQKLISLNVRIFNGLGFHVTADNFRQQARSEDQNDSQIVNQSQSQNSQIDYGESEDDSQPVMPINEYQQDHNHQQDESIDHHSNGLSSFHHQYMFDESEQSNNESPFFLQPIRQEGMSRTQINNLPTMQWSHAHNVFNRGQKCPVCLQEFQMGNTLRVMECLHRYHIECLDEWLSLKANCPSCRNPHNRQGGSV